MSIQLILASQINHGNIPCNIICFHNILHLVLEKHNYHGMNVCQICIFLTYLLHMLYSTFCQHPFMISWDMAYGHFPNSPPGLRLIKAWSFDPFVLEEIKDKVKRSECGAQELNCWCFSVLLDSLLTPTVSEDLPFVPLRPTDCDQNFTLNSQIPPEPLK